VLAGASRWRGHGASVTTARGRSTMMASGAMVGWCSGSRRPSRPGLGFGGSTHAPVCGVRDGDMEEQDGTQRTGVHARGHRFERTTHRLGPSGSCMQVYAGVQNSASAVMATDKTDGTRTTTEQGWYAHTSSWPKKGKALVLECTHACVWWFDQEDRALTPRLSKSRVLAAQPRRRHRLVDARGTN
jgi:hypothetical protein